MNTEFENIFNGQKNFCKGQMSQNLLTQKSMVQIRLYAEIYELVSNTLRCTLMTQFKKVFF